MGQVMGQLMGLSLGALGSSACSAKPQPAAPRARARVETPIGLWSWFDLPNDPRSRELSGIAWDDASRTLWAVQDNQPNIIALKPDPSFKRWSFGDSINVTIGGPLDLEGIVVIPEGFIVCSEEGPRVVELDRKGTLRGEVRIPARFRDARRNKSLESLTMTPDGHYLFTASEQALERDGTKATNQNGTLVRILRFERDRAGSATEVSEHAYLTEPASAEGGDQGVADLCAIADDDLLVLERGWTKGLGNSDRVFRVKLEERASCLGVAQLRPDMPVLTKSLLVDLGRLAVSGLPEPKQPQASPLLDNYEGIALGPPLPDGRSSIFLVSDDNGRSDQFARVLVLACGVP
jgi:hypothetical protein